MEVCHQRRGAEGTKHHDSKEDESPRLNSERETQESMCGPTPSTRSSRTGESKPQRKEAAGWLLPQQGGVGSNREGTGRNLLE